MNSSKRIPRSMDFSTPSPSTTTPVGLDVKTGSTTSLLAKWIPLICAGAAVGVSIMALKEIKNVRKDLILLKKEQMNNSST